MNQKFKELWVIPIVPGIISGLIVGIPLMVWGAWYSGVKWHSLFSGYWLKRAFSAPVPVWACMMVLLLALFVSSAWRSQRQKPLTVDWDPEATVWVWIEGSQTQMRVFGAGLFSLTTYRRTAKLVRAYLKEGGSRSVFWHTIELKCGVPELKSFELEVVAPEKHVGEHWKTEVTFVDDRDNRYTVPVIFKHDIPLG